MRTDTATFRQNAFKSLRSQGVNSVKAKEIVRQLAYQFSAHGHPVLPDTTRITVSIDGEHDQSVAVVNEGLVTLHLDTWTLRALQPLVNCTPTPRQIEIGEKLAAMMPDLYAAIGDACDAWEVENGRRPQVDEDWDDRSAFSRAFPAVVAINATYDALKAESLAINPNVDAHLVDPDKASHWYDWVKDFRGYRPTGFHTLAMVVADMERLQNERPYDEEQPYVPSDEEDLLLA
jgi:hypothetical protein